MNIEHIESKISSAPSIRSQNFDEIRINVVNGKIKFSQNFISKHQLIDHYGLDYGLVEENGEKKLVIVKVPLNVMVNGSIQYVNPIPHICGSQKLKAKGGFKGSVSRPEIVEDLRKAILPKEKNVFSFDLILCNPRVVPYVECVNHKTKSPLVKRYNVEVFDIKLVNIDRI